jgi:mycoredoxin-dependent peroxiredoxin
MKKVGLILLVFALLVGGASTGQSLQPSPEVGDNAPEFSLSDVSGRVVSLSDFKGKKNVVLIFYSHHGWTLCLRQLGELQERISEIKKLNTEVIAFASTGDQNDVESTKTVLGITYTLIPKPNRKVAEDFGVWDNSLAKAIATIIIDKNGRIRSKQISSRPSASSIIRELEGI